MAKEARGSTNRQTYGPAAMPNIGALIQFNERAMEGAMTAGEAMIKGMADLSEAMFSFAQTRLQEDLKTCQALMHRCGSPGEIYDCQRQFAEQASSQYLDMANKLMSLAGRIAGSPWTPPRTGTAAGAGKTRPQSR